jgi:hypothetical protein
MSSLLDRYIPTQAPFRPKSASDVFALRLAQKLQDAPAVRHYVSLADGHTESQMLGAYRRTLRASSYTDRGRQFFVELRRSQVNGSQNGCVRLISIRVERRTVAATIFHGQHLEYADSRQLSSDRGKALESAVSFIMWMLDRFPVESAALEAIPHGFEYQRRLLHDAICGTFRERLLPIWEIPKIALLQGCGHPPPVTRAELREIATGIWPILAGTHAKVFIQDAAIVGLHVQTERLFIIN